jgi:hypothetical protein
MQIHSGIKGALYFQPVLTIAYVYRRLYFVSENPVL